MKILIIDDSVLFREVMSVQLSRGITNATVDIYEFEILGKPADNFDWAQYDILLMDYNLGGDGIGLNWLREYRRSLDFPPVIMLTEEGNEYVAVKAIKFGASNYLNKNDIEKNPLLNWYEVLLANRHCRTRVELNLPMKPPEFLINLLILMTLKADN